MKKEGNMFFNVLKANNIVDLEGNEFTKKILLENHASSMTIIALKKDAIIDTHTSACDAAIYVLDGEIDIHFEAEKFKIDKGEILMFKKDKEHKVVAQKDSKFFVIKI
jgi:quercetin dioxygenase-like cupin family protein